MADSGFDIEGFKKKVQNAKALRTVFLNVHRDAVSFFHFAIVNEILNLPPDAQPGTMQGFKAIRRLTGMLVRSVGRTFNDFDSKLFFNPAIASYVFKMFDYAKERYGMNPIQLVNFFFSSDVRKRATEAISNAFKQVAAGEKVTYRNPFPIIN